MNLLVTTRAARLGTTRIGTARLAASSRASRTCRRTR